MNNFNHIPSNTWDMDNALAPRDENGLISPKAAPMAAANRFTMPWCRTTVRRCTSTMTFYPAANFTGRSPTIPVSPNALSA